MRRHHFWISWCLVAASAAPGWAQPPAPLSTVPAAPTPVRLPSFDGPTPVTRTAHDAAALPPVPDTSSSPDGAVATPLQAKEVALLEMDAVATEVIARNPTVQAMSAAWQAAAQRYPQLIALDDPMFDGNVGPASWGNPEFHSAYMVMLSQKIPWPGKRQLRAGTATEEANGAFHEIENTQLELAELARMTFCDYYAAFAERELNEVNLSETRAFRDTAEAQLRANQVSQQDVLQADVELALLQRRRNEIKRELAIASARLNTLMHRDARTPLPPPAPLTMQIVLPPVDVLQFESVARRPDLATMAAELRADQLRIASAWKEFYPDVEWYAKYDAFWQEMPLRAAVGMRLNLPRDRVKRCAAVREARAMWLKRNAEFERRVDEITNEVHAASAQVEESRENLALFDERILPAARQNVEVASAAYATGRLDFLRVIEAQRQLVELREQRVETLADLHRRRATLQRAVAVGSWDELPNDTVVTGTAE